MRLSIGKAAWAVHVAWMALHQMSWEQLRATAVWEPERRREAWAEMERRSARVRAYGSEAAKQFGREHGH